jgi:flagellar biogenesis protein FliO
MSILRVLNSINAFAVDTNQPITLVNVNGQTVYVSHPEKTLSIALKIQAKLESCKHDNGLASELYDFSADLSKQLSDHQTHQKPCKRQN